MLRGPANSAQVPLQNWVRGSRCWCSARPDGDEIFGGEMGQSQLAFYGEIFGFWCSAALSRCEQGAAVVLGACPWSLCEESSLGTVAAGLGAGCPVPILPLPRGRVGSEARVPRAEAGGKVTGLFIGGPSTRPFA